LAALAIINLSYGAAGVLGFRGLWAPFKALRSYTHGYVVGVFVVGMIFLVVIFMRKGFSWDVCKKWVIGMEIGLAIFAITFAWYPQPIFKAEMKHRERAQIVQHIGSMLLTSAEMPVYTLQKLTLTNISSLFDNKFIPLYKEEDKSASTEKTSSKPQEELEQIHLYKGVKYPIVDLADIKSCGPYRFMSIYLPAGSDDLITRQIGWVRIDDPDKTEIIAKSNFVLDSQTSTTETEEKTKVYHRGKHELPPLKAGEMFDYWFTFSEGVLIDLDSKDYKFNIIYPDGDIKSAWLLKTLPNKYKFKLKAVTDQKITLTVK
ncbi:MAG: hypothetical protein KAJ48_04375, partial [Elusimicrobiales bacterium]|nr:hypothetical protein [Elusimicrobiales bacterium]